MYRISSPNNATERHRFQGPGVPSRRRKTTPETPVADRRDDCGGSGIGSWAGSGAGFAILLERILCITEYSVMNDPLSNTPAGELLESIKLSRPAMRQAIRAHCGHWYLWIWGLIWLAMALL